MLFIVAMSSIYCFGITVFENGAYHHHTGALLRSKICNINFWNENDLPPFGTFPKIHPIW